MTNLTVIGGLYENSITIRCNTNNHIFSISYQKKLCQLNCQSCRLHDKNLRKEELIQEDIAQAKLNEMHQQKMFEDARRKMAEELRKRQSSSTSSSSSSSSKRFSSTQAWMSNNLNTEREYDFQAEQDINRLASRQTREYINSNRSLLQSNELLQKTMLVYKFLATPENWLLQGL